MNGESTCGMHPIACYSVLKRKEILTRAATWMNLEGNMLNNLDTKGQILCDSTYISSRVVRFSEMVQSRCGVLWGEELGKAVFSGHRVLVCKMEKGLGY